VVVAGQLALSPGAKVEPKPYNVPNGGSAEQVKAKSAM
jgi:hypothetical protein